MALAVGLHAVSLHWAALTGSARLEARALDGIALACADHPLSPPAREPAHELAIDANEGDPWAESSGPEVEFDGGGLSNGDRAVRLDRSAAAPRKRLLRTERAAGRRRSRAPPV